MYLPPASLPDGTIRVDGSSTVFPLTLAAKRAFEARYANVKVELKGTEQGESPAGSGGGFRKFCAGETDLSDASRFINTKEIDKARLIGLEFIEIPLAFDGLSVVVHPENDWVDSLSVEELRRIWEPNSKVKTWRDVRESFPDEPLAPFGAGIDSGTYDYFTEAINGEARKSRRDYTASEDDAVLVRGILANKYALGFLGYAYVVEYPKLKVLAIDNGHGPVKPSVETIANGTYQPLSRPLFVYVKLESAQRPEVDAFVHFFLSDIRKYVREVGYCPLSDEAYQLVRERYERRIAGSLAKSNAARVDLMAELKKGP